MKILKAHEPPIKVDILEGVKSRAFFELYKGIEEITRYGMKKVGS